MDRWRCGRSGTHEPHSQLADLDLELIEAGLLECRRQGVDGGKDGVITGAAGAISHVPSYRRKTSVALCPPKPKLLLMATSTSDGRASFGT